MTALPDLTVTATAAQILGNLVGGSTLSETALYNTAVTFVSNVPADHFVLWESRLEKVPPVVARFAPDGTLMRNGDPVKLLKNDVGLNVSGIQWTCQIVGMEDFTFDADADVDLSSVASVPNVAVVGTPFTEASIVALLTNLSSPLREALDALYESGADGSITFAKLAAVLVVTSTETIAAHSNDTMIPTTAAVSAAITAALNAFIAGAPGALDTWLELVAAIQSDESGLAALVATVATKAPINSPTFTGTVAGITKLMVGLPNVDNVSEATILAAAAAAAQRANAVDIRDHITTGTTFDIQAVINAMEQGSGECFIPPGDWTPNAFNVHLDDTLVTGTGSAVTRFKYKFRGSGGQSRILLPSGMGTTDFLFIANSANTNTYLSHPKIILEDFSVSGTNSPNGSLLKVNQRSFIAHHVWLAGILNGFIATGYCDDVKIEYCYALLMTAGGWVYKNTGLGDGGIIDQLIYDNSSAVGGGVSINGCHGLIFRSCTGGYHEFIGCDVTFEGNHNESNGDSTNASRAVHLLRGCTANIISGYYESRGTVRPQFQIDDASGLVTSNVVFHEGVMFVQRFDDPASTSGAGKAIDVDINNMSLRSEVTFRGAKCFVYSLSTAQGNGGSGYANILVPRVTASGMSAIQTALTNNPLRPSTNSTIRYTGGGVWEISPADRAPIPTKAIATTFLSGAAASSPFVTTDGSTGTYYYKAWIVDVAGRVTVASAEAAVTTTSGNPLAALTFNTQEAPVQLILVRGTATGVYDHWASIPIAEKVQTFYDQGSHVGGATWGTSGIPTPPTVSSTHSGLLFYDTGNSEIWATAAPSAGAWILGDHCWNATPANGAPIGWICTVAGAPGTWVAMPNMMTSAGVPKTANYTAKPNEIVEVDPTAATVTITWPTAPPDGTMETIKNIAAAAALGATAHPVSIALGTGDHFNTPTGSTTGSVIMAAGAITGRYDAAQQVWIVISSDLSVTQADSRYLGIGATVDGQPFTAGAATVIAPATHAATSKTTPVGADEIPLTDSASGNVLRKLTWTNLLAALSAAANAFTATKLATARKINGVLFDGSADIVAGLDFPRTQMRVATNRAVPVTSTNGANYQRVIGSGTISKVGVWVKVSSGNISVAAYANSGSGSTAVPGAQLATSGAVACPAAGYAEISLGASVSLKDGDWLAISSDNVTATFASPLTDGGVANDLGKGWQYGQLTAHPLPSPAGSVFGTVGFDIMLKGVA